MMFTVEHVKILLQSDLVTELEKLKMNIIVKIKQFPYLGQSKLCEHLTVLKTVRRDLLVERGFLCVLPLSSVCVCFVHRCYKSYDAMLKYKIVFNQLVKPREFSSFN